MTIETSKKFYHFQLQLAVKEISFRKCYDYVTVLVLNVTLVRNKKWN